MELLNRSGRLLCVVLVLATYVARAQSTPDLVLRGRIHATDHQTYKLVPFDVPQGVSRITVKFDYTGREERTTIDLGLVGPDGFAGRDGLRGWSGGNKKTFTISATDATASYLPGAITPGRWNVLLGVPNIRKEKTSDFTIEIFFEREGTFSDTNRVRFEPVLRNEPGWYRGDLHMHTGHSDGSCSSQRGTRVPCPLFPTLSAAAGRQLDFVAVTEHNTISHLHELRALQPYFDNVLLIPGMEVTTFQGHANVFGVTTAIDFRVGSNAVPTWNALLQTLAGRDVVVSINHPGHPSGEICMGCGWQPDPPADLNRVQAIEVVNGIDADTPISGVPFWHRQLNEGFRITGIGGSDNHDSSLTTASLGKVRIGTPATVVYASALSWPALREGLRSGNVFIDVQGTSDRFVDLTARTLDGTIPMGGELSLAAGQNAELTVRVRNVPGGHIEVVRDGITVRNLPNADVAGSDHTLTFQESGDGTRHWIRVNVRDAQGVLALVGNPIYVNRGRTGTRN